MTVAPSWYREPFQAPDLQHVENDGEVTIYDAAALGFEPGVDEPDLTDVSLSAWLSSPDAIPLREAR